MILDTSAKKGTFVTHQGSICTDFSELLGSLPREDSLFKRVRTDVEETPYTLTIPHKNEHIQAETDLTIPTVLSRFADDSQFKKLPQAVQDACLQLPAFRLPTFLHHVAQGKQDKAQALLESPEYQSLQTTPGTFTDYSGRTFHCTAYEYAYWAKDTHMCRMLERHMEPDTKVRLLERVEAIEHIDAATRQPTGLVYQQGGREHRSAHFDLTPLETALNTFVQGYDAWDRVDNVAAMTAAWMQVGVAQRDVPVHVINEYCRPDRSFFPTPAFNEATLPQVVTFYNFISGNDVALYPLVISDSSGLGVDFGVGRAWGPDLAVGLSLLEVGGGHWQG